MSSNDLFFKLNWNVVDKTESFNRKFNANQINSKVKCDYNIGQNEVSIDQIIIQLEIAINQMIHQILRGAKSNDRIRISLRNNLLDFDCYVPFRQVSDFTTESLLNQIIKISQSKKEFLFLGYIEIDIIHVKDIPIGGNRSKNSVIDLEKWKTNSKKVVKIVGDGLCSARAIVVSKAYVDGIKGLEWRRVRSDRMQEQYMRAKDLCEKSHISLPIEGIRIEDFERFHDFLSPEYQLIVVTPPKEFFFIGQPFSEKQIFVLLSNNHCDSLLSIKAFLKCDYFCKRCIKGYVGRLNHSCEETCKCCFGIDPCIEATTKICESCHRMFVSEMCFNRHKNETKICNQIKKCNECSKVYKGKNHECFKKCFKTCNMNIPYNGHLCYISPLDKFKLKSEDENKRIFIFFDFESILIPRKMNEFVHKPNLCVLNIVCDECWRKDLKDRKEEHCFFCGQKEYIFRSTNCIRDFNKFLFSTFATQMNIKKINFNLKSQIIIHCFAHNGRSYDTQFILKYCIENRMKPNILKRGTKILSMKMGNYKFIDSISFLPMPLRKMPAAFGLENSVKKGIFPYLFNTIENQDYVGKLPSIEYYDPNFMGEKERENFFVWYNKNKDKEFTFKNELEDYCKSDVNILMRCVMTFRDIFKEISGLDPFSRSITIAMSTMEIFRANYLKPKILAIYPFNGYDIKRKSSYIGNAWLDYIEMARNIEIQREYRIGNYYCDGIYLEMNIIFEFYGCIFHGCIDCFPNRRSYLTNPINGQTMENLYINTLERENYLKSKGFSLTIKWECKLNNEIKKSKTIAEFYSRHKRNLKNCRIKPPLDVRDSFFGGRTSAIKLYHEINEELNEKIHYFDVISLYPYVVKTKKYPVGHPVIIKNPENLDINPYNGFIFLKILPPKNLFFPVLPVRLNNKLVFPLCYECAKIQNNKISKHDENIRSIVGTYTTMEVKKAVEKIIQF